MPTSIFCLPRWPSTRRDPSHRAAGLEAVVLDVLDRIAGGRALLAQLVGDVLGLEILVGDEQRDEPGTGRAALGHEVDATPPTAS